MLRIVSRFLLLVAASLLPLVANAQAFRAYIASYGNDGNPCTVALPCRLLPAALNAIAAGGEIWMLDSANFNSGTVTITKSVNILAAPGQVGSLVAFGGGPALVMSGGSTVSLRNLSITNNVTNPGTDGIAISGGSLQVEDCVIGVGFSGSGINATGGSVSVHRTTFRASYDGIFANGSTVLSVTSSHFVGIPDYGIHVENNIAGTTTRVTVADSSFSDVLAGVVMNGNNATSIVKASITRSTFSNAGYGVATQVLTAGSQAVTSVSNSIFSGGSYALFNYGAAVSETLGNNTARNNLVTSSGTITSAPSF